MKNIFIFLILCNTAFAQFDHPNDYRLIGTNVYDFSSAGNPAQPSGYLVSGKISHIYPKSVEVSIPTGTVFVPDAENIRGSFYNDGPAGQLQALVAFRMGQQPLSAGAYFALSPEMRANFKEVETYKRIYILNFQDVVLKHSLSVGAKIQTLAIPTAIPDFWDHGIPFDGDLSGFKFIYRVRSDRIVCERQYSPEEIRLTDMKLLAYQLQQASNNVASDQYEIGKRYLNGKGVETNMELAIYWINAAASNSFPAAMELQKSLTNTNTPNSVPAP